MGIFSNDYIDNQPINIEEAYGYDNDEYSAQIAMIESYQNSFAIFDGVIRSDIQEAAMTYQGVNEEEVMLFSEGVIGDLFNKIKEFFKKLWAKIKAIFHNFMAKWDSKMMSSNKEFIKKYRKDIYGKNIQDLEVDMRKRIVANFPEFPDRSKDLTWSNDSNKFDSDYWDKQNQDFDSNDYTCEILSATLGGKANTVSNVSEYEKEAMDYCFEDSGKEEVQPLLSGIIGRMMEFKEYKRNLEKANKSLEKCMSDIIKAIDRDQKEILDKMPQNDKIEIARRRAYFMRNDSTANGGMGSWSADVNDDELQKKNGKWTGGKTAGRSVKKSLGEKPIQAYQKALNHIHQKATCIQTAATKFTAVTLKIIKFDNSQNRRILAKVIAYKKKEEAFSEEFADLIEWEADCVGVY